MQFTINPNAKRAMTYFNRANLFHRGLLLALPLLLLALVACDSSPTNGDDNDDHPEAARVELQTRGAASAVLAVWTDGEGWTDADGNGITELPNPVDVEGEGLLPMQARGGHASLSVRFFFPDGSEVEMGTISRDDVTGERQCTPSSARYAPTDLNTNIIAWPNMRHPDSPDGPFQFAERGNGDVVGIFHCDHIYFYPEEAGTVDVEFLLWHIDHADEVTDPLTIRVEEGAEPARFELETRGVPRTILATWNAWDGWTDEDGNSISSIDTPRQVEGGDFEPLRAFGSNASLTVRYFAEGGEEVEFQTVSRQEDGPRERICSDISGRYAVEDDATDVIAWPPTAHPDGAYGDDQFAPRTDDTLVGIFHCDHIHVYPEAAGEVEVRLLAWDGDGAVAETGPITLPVVEND